MASVGHNELKKGYCMLCCSFCYHGKREICWLAEINLNTNGVTNADIMITGNKTTSPDAECGPVTIYTHMLDNDPLETHCIMGTMFTIYRQQTVPLNKL